MPLSRHKATSQAGIGEICEFRCESLDAGYSGECVMFAECAEGEAGIMF
jgi:hypothetical protein